MGSDRRDLRPWCADRRHPGRAPSWPRRRDGQDGSTLLLVPAVVLVLILLAGIAVDTAVVHLGQRRLADLAAGLANDAVAAIDEAAFYGRGEIEVVRSRSEARRDIVLAELGDDPSLHDVVCEVLPDGDTATVHCTGRARPVFGAAVPGARAFYELRAQETARAAQG